MWKVPVVIKAGHKKKGRKQSTDEATQMWPVRSKLSSLQQVLWPTDHMKRDSQSGGWLFLSAICCTAELSWKMPMNVPCQSVIRCAVWTSAKPNAVVWIPWRSECLMKYLYAGLQFRLKDRTRHLSLCIQSIATYHEHWWLVIAQGLSKHWNCIGCIHDQKLLSFPEGLPWWRLSRWTEWRHPEWPEHAGPSAADFWCSGECRWLWGPQNPTPSHLTPQPVKRSYLNSAQWDRATLPLNCISCSLILCIKHPWWAQYCFLRSRCDRRIHFLSRQCGRLLEWGRQRLDILVCKLPQIWRVS